MNAFAPVELLRRAAQLEAEWVSWRRHLHQNPELSWQEHETARFITEKLQSFGLNPQAGKCGGTGVWVDIGSGDRMVAYRADIDALPIKDCIATPYVSVKEGVGHECGHDVHTTVALAIARLLKENEDSLPGRIRIFFQPAEEVQPSGAPGMIADGVLEGVEAVYAIHVDPAIDSGEIGIAAGPVTASYYSFDAKFEAPASLHSARPHSGPNAMTAAIQFASEVQHLPYTQLDARRPAVISVTNFHAGEAINIIPGTARIQGTVRTRFNEDSQKLIKAVKRLADNISSLHGVPVHLGFKEGALAVENHPALHRVVENQARGFSTKFKLTPFLPSMGGEDFAYYALKIPGYMLRVGTRNGPDTSYALHSNRFDVDEKVIAPVSAALTYLLIQHLLTYQKP